jgi:hypothetical protein
LLVNCDGSGVVTVEFKPTVPTDVGTTVGNAEDVLEKWVETSDVARLVVFVVVKVTVAIEEIVGLVLEEVADAAGGGMTLKLTVAPHSARERLSGQQPAFVQY